MHHRYLRLKINHLAVIFRNLSLSGEPGQLSPSSVPLPDAPPPSEPSDDTEQAKVSVKGVLELISGTVVPFL